MERLPSWSQRPAACQDAMPTPLPVDQTEPETSDDSPEVTATSQSSHHDSGLLETLVESQSTVPLPRRGTRPRKQPERYAQVRRLQVLPVGCTGWTARVAVSFNGRSRNPQHSSPRCPTNPGNSKRNDGASFETCSWPNLCTLGLGLATSILALKVPWRRQTLLTLCYSVIVLTNPGRALSSSRRLRDT